MKVLSVSHLFPNNVYPNKGVFVKERLKYISRKIDLKVIAPVPYFPFIHKTKRYLGIDNVNRKEVIENLDVLHPKYLTIPKYFKYLDGYLYHLSLANLVKKIASFEKIDILDLHWGYPDSFAGVRWAKELNKKIVLTVRGNESICYFENSFRKKMAISTLKKVDFIISVTNDLKNKMINDYGINPEKISVISNGIDSNQFYLRDKIQAKKSCGLDTRKSYVLSLCNLSPEKGLQYLLKAFSRLEQKDVILLVVGEGVLKNDLIELARDLSITDNVRFIGAINHKEVSSWFSASDIYCLPSLWEGCPNTVIESLASGTPVVSTQVGGVPDLIPSESYGYLVPPGDETSLFHALKNALSKKWDRGEIAKLGTHNTWDHVADSVINVFNTVLLKN